MGTEASHGRSILHIDVNSAYLSWTAVEFLAHGRADDIRRIPSAIAGDPRSRHGIILAKSEPAKKYGIKTAMTLAEAQRRCPDLALFPPDHAMYKVYSDRMYALLCEYTDIIERFSIDECWLDYTGSEKIFGPPLEAARAISARIRKELGFTVNIGVSTNKLLAKMASEREKPDKIHTLYPGEIAEKMWPLPTDELFGVGHSTKQALARVGLRTIGDVAHADAVMLRQLLKPVMGQLVHDHANGIDDTPVLREELRAEKSIGHSTTTPRDVTDEEEALRYLLSLSERVGLRLRDAGLEAGVASVELKNKSFYTYRHQKKLPSRVRTTSEIYEAACAIFREMWRGDDLRLIGVSLTDLAPAGARARQISLFEDPEETARGRAIEETQDEIRKKFGRDAIKRGTLV
ncbi:MAG: DNA polymerase IV [Clostridiales Family XIII bacterium]|jgi:DNA polymerase-4|nr:DNA polymerase IV [Clostridiales Family XIII bacterium]